MSRYDITRASDLVLLAVARAAIGSPTSRSLPLDRATRRCLEAFATVLVVEPAEDFQELAALRFECRVRTRQEYDREIGDLLRSGNPNPLLVETLVGLSRTAPEGEP